MYTLFISTYNEKILISLLKDNNVIDQKESISKNSHSISLMPTIKAILNANNLHANNLHEILVINGPGSFTGVRLGITVAKTLAYTLNIPIKTISSLDAMAVSVSNKSNIMVVLADSKGKYVGKYIDGCLKEKPVYLTNNDFITLVNNYKFDVVENVDLDVKIIYEYAKKLEPINPHNVKATYIKIIEVLHDQ